MKRIALAALFLFPLFALGEDEPSALQTLDLSGTQSGPGSVSACGATLAACKQFCRDTSARADVRHFDEPDVSVSVCINDSETEASICKKDC